MQVVGREQMIWVGVGILMVVGWGLLTYNALVQGRVRADGAWSDISVQLKRRYDLIPNVVEAVKGYAAHEQQVFVEVTKARTRAIQAQSPKAKEQAEGQLGGALRGLFALAEQYPDLKANEHFLGLQQALTQVEDALQGARRYYNAVVRDYNTRIAVLPDRLIAQAGRFASKEFFQLEHAQEAGAPRVSFPTPSQRVDSAMAV
jgi:LemA protein